MSSKQSTLKKVGKVNSPQDEKKSIIHCIVAKLGANVPYMNAFERLVCLQVSDLTDKWVRAKNLASNNQSK
jgi:hypothetical protein